MKMIVLRRQLVGGLLAFNSAAFLGVVHQASTSNLPYLFATAAFGLSVPMLAVLYWHRRNIEAVGEVFAELRPHEFPSLNLAESSIADSIANIVVDVLTVIGAASLLARIDATFALFGLILGAALALIIWSSHLRSIRKLEEDVEPLMLTLLADMKRQSEETAALSRKLEHKAELMAYAENSREQMAANRRYDEELGEVPHKDAPSSD
jgi:ABC-type multidrug transport system fused ATPase/permease subunit